VTYQGRGHGRQGPGQLAPWRSTGEVSPTGHWHKPQTINALCRNPKRPNDEGQRAHVSGALLQDSPRYLRCSGSATLGHVRALSYDVVLARGAASGWEQGQSPEAVAEGTKWSNDLRVRKPSAPGGCSQESSNRFSPSKINLPVRANQSPAEAGNRGGVSGLNTEQTQADTAETVGDAECDRPCPRPPTSSSRGT
jgi:hypothetical protein